MEPDLGSNVMYAMLSTESGIVDSHALMMSLESEIGEEREGDGSGSVAVGTTVVRIDPFKGENGKPFIAHSRCLEQPLTREDRPTS